MASTKITGKENGPYLLSGSITYTDAAGNEQTTEGKMVALCRCGGSANKPFCDGAHRRNGFEGAKIELVFNAE